MVHYAHWRQHNKTIGILDVNNVISVNDETAHSITFTLKCQIATLLQIKAFEINYGFQFISD